MSDLSSTSGNFSYSNQALQQASQNIQQNELAQVLEAKAQQGLISVSVSGTQGGGFTFGTYKSTGVKLAQPGTGADGELSGQSSTESESALLQGVFGSTTSASDTQQALTSWLGSSLLKSFTSVGGNGSGTGSGSTTNDLVGGSDSDSGSSSSSLSLYNMIMAVGLIDLNTANNTTTGSVDTDKAMMSYQAQKYADEASNLLSSEQDAYNAQQAADTAGIIGDIIEAIVIVIVVVVVVAAIVGTDGADAAAAPEELEAGIELGELAGEGTTEGLEASEGGTEATESSESTSEGGEGGEENSDLNASSNESLESSDDSSMKDLAQQLKRLGQVTAGLLTMIKGALEIYYGKEESEAEKDAAKSDLDSSQATVTQDQIDEISNLLNTQVSEVSTDLQNSGTMFSGLTSAITSFEADATV